MQNIWLYHINPKSRYGYDYGWDFKRPETILKTSDRTWSSGRMAGDVKKNDLICVYMKRIGKRPSGVHVVGKVTAVFPETHMFTWRPDPNRSAQTLLFPILKEDIRKYFPRSYGDSIQLLDPIKRQKWLTLLGFGKVTQGVPRAKARVQPKDTDPPKVDPNVHVQFAK